jgi:hypothetical protein
MYVCIIKQFLFILFIEFKLNLKDFIEQLHRATNGLPSVPGRSMAGLDQGLPNE